MLSISKSPLPSHALLAEYSKNGCHTDCYTTEVSVVVSHAEFVEAFYTTRLFKLERLILKWLVGKPSTDHQAHCLGAGKTETFAAWYVERRAENQILLCDFQNRTRSWLMVAPTKVRGDIGTRLYFGSAVVPVDKRKTGATSLGLVFKLLGGFHKAYSVALLYSSKWRVESQRRFDRERKED